MKFISCNIEGNKHFERLFPFFEKEQADVVALQEVFECDLEDIKQATGLSKYFFYPNANVSTGNDHLPPRGIWGVAIFANKIVDHSVTYYVRQKEGTAAEFLNERPDLIDRAALVAKVQVGGDSFQILTTHFTWSGKGEVSDLQRRDYANLSLFLSKFEEIIFCGDLNTPRGFEIWQDLASKYRDNIPPEVVTTIDKNLHKSGQDIRLVIDGLFTSSHYVASEVRAVPNTSDHMAVVAKIERVS